MNNIPLTVFDQTRAIATVYISENLYNGYLKMMSKYGNRMDEVLWR